jgi:hypothetical protein
VNVGYGYGPREDKNDKQLDEPFVEIVIQIDSYAFISEQSRIRNSYKKQDFFHR